MRYSNVDGYPDYYVSRSGRVFKLEEGKWVEKYPFIYKKSGTVYSRKFITLSSLVDGVRHRKKFILSRLVAIVWVPNPDNKPCVCHIDNNPLNNRADNLYWGTYKENNIQAVLDGRHVSNNLIGERNPHSKLTDKQRYDMLKDYKTGNYTHKSLSIKYGLKSVSTLYHLLNPNYTREYRDKSKPSLVMPESVIKARTKHANIRKQL